MYGARMCSSVERKDNLMLHVFLYFVLSVQLQASSDEVDCYTDQARDERCIKLACFWDVACHGPNTSMESAEKCKENEGVDEELQACIAKRDPSCEYEIAACEDVQYEVQADIEESIRETEDAEYERQAEIEERQREQRDREMQRAVEAYGGAYFIFTGGLLGATMPTLVRTIMAEVPTGDLVSTHMGGAGNFVNFEGVPWSHENIEFALGAQGYYSFGNGVYGGGNFSGEVRAGHYLVKGYFKYGFHIRGGRVYDDRMFSFRKGNQFAEDRGDIAGLDLTVAKGRGWYYAHRLSAGLHIGNPRHDAFKVWVGPVFEKTSLPWSGTTEPRKLKAWIPGAEAGVLIGYGFLWGFSTEFLLPYDSMTAGDPKGAVLNRDYGATKPVWFQFLIHLGGVFPSG